MTFFYNTLQVSTNQAVLAMWLSRSRKKREKDELKVYWLLGISVPKQAGKELWENPTRDVEKEEKIGVVVILSPLL